MYAKLNNIASALRRAVDWRGVVPDIKHTVTCIFFKRLPQVTEFYTCKRFVNVIFDILRTVHREIFL